MVKSIKHHIRTSRTRLVFTQADAQDLAYEGLLPSVQLEHLGTGQDLIHELRAGVQFIGIINYIIFICKQHAEENTVYVQHSPQA